MSPGIKEVDETGAQGANVGGMIDEKEMDATPPIRQVEHPYGKFCNDVREALQLPNSQSTREVVSAVVRAVSDLAVVEKDQIEEQAKHIAEMVAEDRKNRNDPQLWTTSAARIAEHVLKLRLDGKAPVSALAQAD